MVWTLVWRRWSNRPVPKSSESASDFLSDTNSQADAELSSGRIASRPIAVADMQELCASLLGVDTGEFFPYDAERKGASCEESAEDREKRNWPGVRARDAERENRLMLNDDEKKQLLPVTDADIQERHLLFPDKGKSTKPPSSSLSKLTLLTMRNKRAFYAACWAPMLRLHAI